MNWKAPSDLIRAPKMMLRSRNTNVMNQQGAAKDADHPVKRGASKQISEDNNKENVVGGEPKPKRAALSELRNQISTGLVIDSTRKTLKKDEAKANRSNGRTQSTSELVPITEDRRSLNDSILVVDEVKAATGEVDPCPEYDYDKENSGDEFNVPEFAFDIFRYYRSRECDFTVGDYLSKHPRLNRDARAVLVDWMIEIQETFELNHETLYLAVKLVDLYLTNTMETVARSELQVIACAAVFVASKYEERQPPLIDDFLYVAEDTFTRPDLESMERKMLKTIGFDLGAPLSYSFVRRYAKASKVDMRTLTLARFILETSLMFYEFARASDSKMAAGSFLLALRMLDSSAEWTPVLHKYSGLSPSEVEPFCWELCHMMHVRSAGHGVNARLMTAHQKYSHEVFFQSASVPLLADKFPLSRPVQATQ